MSPVDQAIKYLIYKEIRVMHLNPKHINTLTHKQCRQYSQYRSKSSNYVLYIQGYKAHLNLKFGHVQCLEMNDTYFSGYILWGMS